MRFKVRSFELSNDYHIRAYTMTTRAQMLCAYSRMSLAALLFAVVGGDDCGCGVADDDHRSRLKRRSRLVACSRSIAGAMRTTMMTIISTQLALADWLTGWLVRAEYSWLPRMFFSS